MSVPHLPVVAIDARLIGGRATGDSTYWTGLVQGLAKIDTGLRFLLFGNAERPEGIPDAANIQWVVVRSRQDRWWSLFRFPLKARRMGATAIHTQYNLSPLAGHHGLTTIHDVSFLIEPSWFRPADRVLLSRFVPASARRAARVLTVSESSARDIARFIPEAKPKLRVTLLGCSTLIQALDPDDARRIVEQDFGVGSPYLLTVGTRWPRKNLGLAIDAVELLPASLPHRLIVTGKPGWGDQSLRSRTVAVGYVTDLQLSALYSAADAFLAPSRYEGFGLTVLEAFQCRCPVLCSTGGALPEVAGKAAKVVESWEPGDWATEIQGLLADSSKLLSMRELGVKRAARFRWEDTAAKTAEAYREVIR